jgi:hypothetical protein
MTVGARYGTKPFLWLGQGKSAIVGDFRVVQLTQNIMVQFLVD